MSLKDEHGKGLEETRDRGLGVTRQPTPASVVFDYDAVHADIQRWSQEAQRDLAEIRKLDLTRRGVFHE